MTSTSSSRPASLSLGAVSAIGADRLCDFAGGQQQRDRVLLDGEQTIEGKLVCVVGAPGTPVGAREVLGEAAWGAPVGASGCSYPHALAAVDGDALPGERLCERLVLECCAYRQPAAALVGGGGQRERCAGEVRVLDGCVGHWPLLECVREPLGGALFAHGHGMWVERLALCGVEFDQSADRRGTCSGERELRESQSAATVVSASVLAISPCSLPICMRRR